MLVSNLNGQRIEAAEAVKGPEYHCPNCAAGVVLKKGRIVTHHFAHKPPIVCGWGRGETDAHRTAKRLFKEEFVSRGLRSEVESEVASLPNDRRADVLVWSPGGHRFALELQHVPIGYEELEQRTRSYMLADVRVIWVPFFRQELWRQAEVLGATDEGDFRIEKFPARPLEKWLHGFNFGELWMYDPHDTCLWKAKLDKHQSYVEETSWYSADGNEEYAGGYWKTSKRWRELTLWGPYNLEAVRVAEMCRPEKEIGNHRYPGGKAGKFVLDS